MRLKEKMQEVIAAEAIRTLLAKHCHSIDNKDPDLFMSIWAEDVYYLLRRDIASGAAEICQLMQKVWTRVVKSSHHIINPIIDDIGVKATVKTDAIYYQQTVYGIIALLSGGHDCAFEQVCGDWDTSPLRCQL